MSEDKFLDARCPKCRRRGLKENLITKPKQGEYYVLMWRCVRCHDIVSDGNVHAPRYWAEKRKVRKLKVLNESDPYGALESIGEGGR